MTQTIDGVCLPLRGGRHVAREEHARQAAWLFLFFPHLGGPPSRRGRRRSHHRCAQYCTDGVGWLTQYPPMSLAVWYYHKADQCARLAKDAIEPRKRSDFENERKLWLQIAEQIEMDEVRWFGPERM